MRHRRNHEQLETKHESGNRPTLLDKVAAYYIDKFSRYPESVRVSFGDGTTAIYELKVEQPEPVFASGQEKTFIGYAWKGAKA